jgi:DNA-binding CsgD family transcriptional regulator
VTDAEATGRPEHKPMLEASQTRSYVVAPICPAGRLIGFLHADRYPDRPVDLVDRDVLWTFAQGFGRIYERTVLMERLRAQRFHIQGTLDLAETIASTLASAEIELGRSPRDEEAIPAPGDVVIEAPGGNASIDELVTTREREVLAMMVMGHANSAIAEKLVIREGTVKSHVKHILRKLGAANRVEAISLYLEVNDR